MLLDLTPDELLVTTRSVRKRLDLTRPVEPEVLAECLAAGPTGADRQLRPELALYGGDRP
jgi:hypothetical protein